MPPTSLPIFSPRCQLTIPPRKIHSKQWCSMGKPQRLLPQAQKFLEAQPTLRHWATAVPKVPQDWEGDGSLPWPSNIQSVRGGWLAGWVASQAIPTGMELSIPFGASSLCPLFATHFSCRSWCCCCARQVAAAPGGPLGSPLPPFQDGGVRRPWHFIAPSPGPCMGEGSHKHSRVLPKHQHRP